MELVEGLSPGSACVTMVGKQWALPSWGGARECKRHVSLTQQLPVLAVPWTHQLVPLHPASTPPACLLPPYCPHPWPCLPPLFTGAGRGVAGAWPSPTSAGDLLNPHLSHASGAGLPCSSAPCSGAGLAGVGSRTSIPPLWGWEVTAEPDPHPVGKGWGVPKPPRSSWMLVLHLSVGQQAPRQGRCHLLVPQEDGHLVGYIFPSGVKSCPTYLGLRLPRRASQAVQRRGVKWASPELLKPSPELPAGCCSPPAAGSVPWPGSAAGGRGGEPLALLSPSPAD